MTTKRFVTVAVLFSALLAWGGMARAQDAPPPDGGGGRGMGHGGHGMDPAARLEHMTKRYKLSADQQTQIKPILADEQQQMQALHSDSSMAREDRFAKMKSIHEQSSAKIEAVLNDSQKADFEKDQAKMQERMHHGPDGEGPGGDAPPPPPPPGV